MKTTTQNQIQDYLQLSSVEYEQMILDHYWSWCHKYSTNDQMLQCFLSNAEINRWFKAQWAKNENDFLKIVHTVAKRPDQLRYHYNGCIVQVYNNWPQPLLEKARPNKTQQVPYMVRLNQFTFYAN